MWMGARHGLGVFAIGSVKRTAAPCVPASSHNWPPCASTIDLHSDNPMPRPSALVEESGRNAFSMSCGGKPWSGVGDPDFDEIGVERFRLDQHGAAHAAALADRLDGIAQQD